MGSNAAFEKRRKWALRGGASAIAAIILLAAVGLSCASGAAWTAPAGVHVADGTLVGPDGGLLRGAYWSTDWMGTLPSAGFLDFLKSKKLNALHLYAESFASGNAPGAYATQVDEMVRRTRAAGMALVITIGNWDRNGSFDLGFARGFWEIYAPRYAKEAHVAYELQNEPVAWFPGYPAEAIAMELELYALVRSLAPERPILLMSYANLRDPPAIARDLEALGSAVDWGRAAIAFHGYSGEWSVVECLAFFKERGIPCVNTEFWDSGKGNVSDDRYQVLAACEKAGVSWLLFFTEGQIDDPTLFDAELERGGVRW